MAKWTIIVLLALLAMSAAVFWTMVFSGFAASGFRATDPAWPSEPAAITPECAWPYDVNDHNARNVCRMFYHLTPEQRAEVLKTRQRAAKP